MHAEWEHPSIHKSHVGLSLAALQCYQAHRTLPPLQQKLTYGTPGIKPDKIVKSQIVTLSHINTYMNCHHSLLLTFIQYIIYQINSTIKVCVCGGLFMTGYLGPEAHLQIFNFGKDLLFYRILVNL